MCFYNKVRLYKIFYNVNENLMIYCFSDNVLQLFFPETKNFVELLFKTLETQEYVLPPPKSEPDGGGTPPGVNPPAPIIPSSTEKIVDATIPLVPIITNPSVPLQINGSAPAVISKRETRKSDSDKDKEKEKRSRSR